MQDQTIQVPNGKALLPSQTARCRAAALTALLSVVLMLALGGCTTYTEQTAHTPAHATTTAISAERHDLDAAIANIAEKFEIALLKTTEYSETDIEYHLISVTDEPIRIRFTLPHAHARTLVEGQATVRYGKFRDESREQAIMRALKSRLRWLAARD